MYKRKLLSTVALCTILASTNNVVATGDEQNTKQTQQKLQQAAASQKAAKAQPVINRTDKEIFGMLVTAAAIGALFAVTETATNMTILN